MMLDLILLTERIAMNKAIQTSPSTARGTSAVVTASRKEHRDPGSVKAVLQMAFVLAAELTLVLLLVAS